MTLPGYDAWKLSSPDDDRHQLGVKEGEECGRYPEPDEDEPRGYKRRPCKGTMVAIAEHPDTEEVAVGCDTCGEMT
jgi:hypothetical protein